MSDQFVGEIRVFGFNFATSGWAKCQGQLQAISQNPTLFSIIGTTFGGNGTTNFALPNLQDLTAVGMGQAPGLLDWGLGGVFGEAGHTLLIGEVPLHSHSATVGEGVAFGTQLAAPTPTGYLGREKGGAYATSPNTTIAGAAIGLAGNSIAHPNIQPVLVMNYCIALTGVFPSRN